MTLTHISEKPWSSYTKADYTPEQWHRACLIHVHDSAPTAKDQCKLPVRTPNGALNRNGVHAAAAALAGARGGVDAPTDEKTAAGKVLIRLYSELGEDPPPSLHHTEGSREGSTRMTDIIIEEVDDFLEHFGVKGMRWGHRQAESSSGSGSGGGSNSAPTRGERKTAKKLAKADKKWDKEFEGVNGFIKMNNAVADRMNGPNGGLAKVNNKPKYNVDLTKPENKKLNDQYMKEIGDQTYSAFVSAAKSFGTNPSGTRRVGVTVDHSNNEVQFQFEDVRHAGVDDLESNLFWTGKLDARGHVISLNKADEEDFLEQAEDMVDDILAHYGVKGMKWGVTTKVSGAVGEAKSRAKKEIAERTDTETHVRTKPGQMVRVVGGTKRKPHEDAIKARVSEQVAKKNTLDALSNKDLQHLVQRMNLESQYRQLASKETRKSAMQNRVEKLVGEKGDVVYSRLGPHAVLGRKVVEGALKTATQNKGLLGGVVKDKNKD